MSITDPFGIEHNTPYPHLYSPGLLPSDICARLYDFFEATDEWHLPEGAAPDDGQIWWLDGKLPEDLAFLESPATKESLKRWLSDQYGVSFGDLCELIANRMEAGQGVRPHTDYHAEAPTHRIVIFITRDWSWDHGGELWLLKSRGQQIERTGHANYPPVSGDAVTFAISPQSYHTVQTCNQGVRYSLTYSFYPPKPQ